MSLANDGSRMWSYNGEIETPSTVLFEQAERRIKAKKEVIEDLQNEYDLLERQAFNLYKSHVRYYYFSPKLISIAQDWLFMINSGKDKDGNKLDKRRRYDQKDKYEFINKRIAEYLGIKDLKIHTIMNYNYGQAYEFQFTYMDQEWRLEIPMVEDIQFKAYKDYGDSCFKLRLTHFDGVICWSTVGTTYNEDDLKDIMAKGIEKYCEEK